MTYTVTDIAELVEYHLVGSAPDDDVAHSNLVQKLATDKMASLALKQALPGDGRRRGHGVWCWGVGAVTVGVGSGWVVGAAWVVGLCGVLGSARRVFLGVAV